MRADRPPRSILPRWWRMQVVATVPHGEVIARVRDDAGWNGRYAFMTLMSAGIAVLGLLQSSPAVVIGAMLISPLMGPIIGLGFALATFDMGEIRRASTALALGTLVAVAFAALVVMLSPLQNVTPEIASRTRPNLFDLMIALFSALAGAYAMIRGRAGTVVGVAIATALMPPLGVIGFGLATLNWSVFSGATLLFFTNFMTIALTAAVMARLFGFGPRLSPHQTALQTVVLLTVLAALAVPLGFALRRVGREALASREARTMLNREFGDTARLGQVDINYDAHPIQLSATVFTPTYHAAADQRLTAAMQKVLGYPVTVSLEQFRVARGQADANAAQQASAAQAQAQAEAARADAAVADRLA
nr:DUF389 domain-containing protein [Pseudomonadota bacterium]